MEIFNVLSDPDGSFKRMKKMGWQQLLLMLAVIQCIAGFFAGLQVGLFPALAMSVIGIIVSPFSFLLIIIIWSVGHYISLKFGGKAKFWQTMTVGVASTATTIVSALLYLVFEFLHLGSLSALAGFAVFLWSLWIQVSGISVFNRFSKGKALVIVLVSWVVMTLLFLVIGTAIALIVSASVASVALLAH